MALPAGYTNVGGRIVPLSIAANVSSSSGSSSSSYTNTAGGVKVVQSGNNVTVYYNGVVKYSGLVGGAVGLEFGGQKIGAMLQPSSSLKTVESPITENKQSIAPMQTTPLPVQIFGSPTASIDKIYAPTPVKQGMSLVPMQIFSPTGAIDKVYAPSSTSKVPMQIFGSPTASIDKVYAPLKKEQGTTQKRVDFRTAAAPDGYVAIAGSNLLVKKEEIVQTAKEKIAFESFGMDYASLPIGMQKEVDTAYGRSYLKTAIEKDAADSVFQKDEWTSDYFLPYVGRYKQEGSAEKAKGAREDNNLYFGSPTASIDKVYAPGGSIDTDFILQPEQKKASTPEQTQKAEETLKSLLADMGGTELYLQSEKLSGEKAVWKLTELFDKNPKTLPVTITLESGEKMKYEVPTSREEIFSSLYPRAKMYTIVDELKNIPVIGTLAGAADYAVKQTVQATMKRQSGDVLGAVIDPTIGGSAAVMIAYTEGALLQYGAGAVGAVGKTAAKVAAGKITLGAAAKVLGTGATKFIHEGVNFPIFTRTATGLMGKTVAASRVAKVLVEAERISNVAITGASVVDIVTGKESFGLLSAAGKGKVTAMVNIGKVATGTATVEEALPFAVGFTGMNLPYYGAKLASVWAPSGSLRAKAIESGYRLMNVGAIGLNVGLNVKEGIQKQERAGKKVNLAEAVAYGYGKSQTELGFSDYYLEGQTIDKAFEASRMAKGAEKILKTNIKTGKITPSEYAGRWSGLDVELKIPKIDLSGKSEATARRVGIDIAGKADVSKITVGKMDLGKIDIAKMDVSKLDLRQDLGKTDFAKMDVSKLDLRQDIGKFDLGKIDFGKIDLGKPDIGKPDIGKEDFGKIDMRPDIGRPDFRPDMKLDMKLDSIPLPIIPFIPGGGSGTGGGGAIGDISKGKRGENLASLLGAMRIKSAFRGGGSSASTKSAKGEAKQVRPMGNVLKSMGFGGFTGRKKRR